MKTLTTLSLATMMTITLAAPAQANTITDTLTEVVTSQMAELSHNIKQQAKSALEKTATELFFDSGSEQAAQNVVQTEDKATTIVKN